MIMRIKKALRLTGKDRFEDQVDNHRTTDDVRQPECVTPAPADPKRQIIAEILMSAGPRKSQDTGLGEDSCGLILRTDRCFFWIADGTSESAVLEHRTSRVSFSSRRLAHDLGDSFRRQALNGPEVREESSDSHTLIDRLLRTSLDEVMQKWSELLKQLQANDKPYLDSAFNEASGNFKDFSSTFLCGVMTTCGSLQIGCYGDSPFAVKIDNEVQVVRPKNLRFFMRLNRDIDGYSFTTSKEFATEGFCFDNVSLLIAGSDGIGRLPEMVKALIGELAFSEIRTQFSLYEPRTHDDKALCILSLEGF